MPHGVWALPFSRALGHSEKGVEVERNERACSDKSCRSTDSQAAERVFQREDGCTNCQVVIASANLHAVNSGALVPCVSATF